MRRIYILLLIGVVLVGIFFINLSVSPSASTPIKTELKNVKVVKVKIVEKELPNQTVYGYSSTVEECDNDPYTTASGKKVYSGVIANNCAEMGYKVAINGVVYTVLDRMNARYGCEVWDIWFPSKEEAIKWGKRVINIQKL